MNLQDISRPNWASSFHKRAALAKDKESGLKTNKQQKKNLLNLGAIAILQWKGANFAYGRPWFNPHHSVWSPGNC